MTDIEKIIFALEAKRDEVKDKADKEKIPINALDLYGIFSGLQYAIDKIVEIERGAR